MYFFLFISLLFPLTNYYKVWRSLLERRHVLAHPARCCQSRLLQLHSSWYHAFPAPMPGFTAYSTLHNSSNTVYAILPQPGRKNSVRLLRIRLCVAFQNVWGWGVWEQRWTDRESITLSQPHFNNVKMPLTTMTRWHNFWTPIEHGLNLNAYCFGSQ